MSSFTIEYESYKVTTSLNAKTIFISMMNINTYAIYEKDITSMDFNNDKFTLKNLYNIFQKGFHIDSTINIGIELHNKILKINLKIISDLMNFEHSFELQEKYDDNIHMKELKKEIDSLKNKLESTIMKELKKEIDSLKNKLESTIIKTKPDSIIPIINFPIIDEIEVEKKYKWFLDWFVKEINIPSNSPKFKISNIMGSSITVDGSTRNLNELGWHGVVTGFNLSGGYITSCVPDLNLYYYLKKRNIEFFGPHCGGEYSYRYIC
jgi:regulator of replication initiation timing